MAYRWSLQGPAFEFPTPYGIENRFLKLRGLMLLVLGLLVVLLGSGEAEMRPASSLLTENTQPAHSAPTWLLALLMAVLGGLDIAQALRQRTLLLAPGKPASLSDEVRREAVGSGAGAAWITQLLARAVLLLPAWPANYGSLLQALGDKVQAAPSTLQQYLQQRLAHLLLGAGLVLLLAVSWLLVQRPPVLALMVALYAMLGGAVVTRHMLSPQAPPPRPLVVIALLAGAAVGGLLLALLLPAELPYSRRLQELGLPLAMALALASGLLFEALGVLAGRAHLDDPVVPAYANDEAIVSFDGDPAQLLQEVDRELHRRWTEGIPNRRYAWLPPTIEPGADSGSFSATVLEESQPMPALQPLAPAMVAGMRRRRAWLLLLSVLGLLWTLAGCVMWAWLARKHVLDGGVPWWGTTSGLALILAGGHVLRIAHLLWSRVEVDSTLTWLEFNGRFVRLPAAPEVTVRGRGEPAPAVETMTLKAWAVQLRSVFYAAAEHPLGSRTLLAMVGDGAAAKHWAQQVRLFADAHRFSAGRVPAAEPPRPRAVRAESEGAPGARPAARFCAACGTPLLAGARFCQQCGTAVPPS